MKTLVLGQKMVGINAGDEKSFVVVLREQCMPIYLLPYKLILEIGLLG